MCGRYFFQLSEQTPANLRKKLEDHPVFDFQQGEIFPSHKALVLVKDGANQEVQPTVKIWGIPGYKGNRIINARMEGIQTKHIFRPILDNRCVIIANHFYEWVKTEEGKEKVAVSKSTPIMYLAGLYTSACEFVIVTGESCGKMKEIHHRTPIIMDEQQMFSYLDKERNFIIDTTDLNFQKQEKASPSSVQISFPL